MALDSNRNKIRPLRTSTAGAQPILSDIEEGEIWINSADRVLGSKQNNKALIIAGFDKDYRDNIKNNKVFLNKSGVISLYTSCYEADHIDLSTVTITPSSNNFITCDANENLTVIVNKVENTNYYKEVKLLIVKDANITKQTTITWNGITKWSNGNKVPSFGSANAANQLLVVLHIYHDFVLATTEYNSEDESLGAVAWGNIIGDISKQSDLVSKFDEYLPVNDPTATGTLTIVDVA